MPTILIVDYGLGNLRSVQKALETMSADASISSRAKDSAVREIAEADALILPGVGAFGDAMRNVEPVREAICEQVEAGKPLLGVCLGLQMLFSESTEGGLFKGLDVFRGRVIRFPSGLKVPHMGWNTLKIVDEDNPLVEGLLKEEYAYFVHSYYAEVKNEKTVVALTEYGVDFPSILCRKNVFATQFHPEKSGRTGLKILENFLNYVKQ